MGVIAVFRDGFFHTLFELPLLAWIAPLIAVAVHVIQPGPANGDFIFRMILLAAILNYWSAFSHKASRLQKMRDSHRNNGRTPVYHHTELGLAGITTAVILAVAWVARGVWRLAFSIGNAVYVVGVIVWWLVFNGPIVDDQDAVMADSGPSVPVAA